MIVVFHGYEVFTRHNPVWSSEDDNWGFAVAPWVMIGFYDFHKGGETSFGLEPPGKVDLNGGIAPPEPNVDRPKNRFKRWSLWILNKI